jgi:hypothetical protein
VFSRLPDGTTIQMLKHPSGNLTILFPRGVSEPPAPTERMGRVQWYVPYTAVHPKTAEAAPRDAIWVNVSHSNIAYYAALSHIWAKGESFALLEHDVVCTPEIIRTIEDCREPWALYWYSDICHLECREAWRNQLGCTLFREEIIRAVPDAVSSIPPDRWDWHNLCDGLGDNLRNAGFTHHWLGEVGHHRETHRL